LEFKILSGPIFLNRYSLRKIEKLKKEMTNTALFSLFLLISSAQFSALYAESDTLEQKSYGRSADFENVRQKLSAKRFVRLGGMCEKDDVANSRYVAGIFLPR